MPIATFITRNELFSIVIKFQENKMMLVLSQSQPGSAHCLLRAKVRPLKKETAKEVIIKT